MPRFPRSKRGVAISHAMFRGVLRRDIFRDDGERYEFLDLMDRKMRTYDVRLLDFSLMTNHVHMIPWGSGIQVGRALRDILGIYGRRFNSRHGLKGHFLEDRFRDFIIRSNAALRRTSQYVQLNPVIPGLSEYPWTYPWSSAAAYAGEAKGLKCLDLTPVLSLYSPSPSGRVRAYRQEMLKVLEERRTEQAKCAEIVAAAELRSLHPEIARAMIEHSLQVKAHAEEAVRRVFNGERNGIRILERIWLRYARKWRTAPSWLLAMLMGKSESTVKLRAREGGEWIRDMAQGESLARRMEAEYCPPL